MKKNKKILFILLLLINIINAQSGQEWQWKSPLPQGNNLRWVKRWDDSHWYLAGNTGTFMKTSDGGATWSFHHKAGRPLSLSGQSVAITDAHFFDMLNGIAIGGLGSIRKTNDGGNTWAEVQSNPLTLNSTITLNQIYFINSTTGYIAGNAGTLLKTTDSGNNWVILPVPFTSNFYDLYTADNQTLLIGTTNGAVLRSTDSGTTWNSVSAAVTGNVLKVQGNGAGMIMICGTNSMVRISLNNGVSWSNVSAGLPPSNAFSDLDLVSNNWLLTGNSSAIFRSADNGSSWDTLSILAPVSQQPWTSFFYATDFGSTPDSFVTAGAYGLINRRAGNEITAKSKLFRLGQWLDIYAESPDGNVIAVGTLSDAASHDQVYRSTDGGNTWVHTLLSGNSSSNIWSIDMTDNLHGFICGSNSAVYKTTNGGISWDSLITTGIPPGLTLRKIDFVNSLTGWVFVSQPPEASGFIYKTTDGGNSWLPQTHNATLQNGIIFGACMIDELNGFLVTGEPRPYKTADGGNSWAAQSLPSGLSGTLYDIKMVDAATGYIVGSEGRVFKTTNGGSLWNLLNVPVTQYPFYSLEVVDENNLIVFGGTGVTLYSHNGGESWDIINTSAISISASAFARNAQTNEFAVFAGGMNNIIMKNSLTPVPVELVSFSVSLADNSIILNWRTISEVNNLGFAVEKRTEGGEWITIGFLRGMGTSLYPQDYSFTDDSNSKGKLYYRLKQTNLDGTSKYSTIVEIEAGVPLTYRLEQNYPNPFNPSTNIQFSLPQKGNVRLTVFNNIGEKVAELVNSTLNAGVHTINFNAAGLSSGIYLYRFESGNIVLSGKMNLLR